MRERVPLQRVQEAIFKFCRGNSEVAIFGAQAVNFYTAVPRMSQDVDLLASRPAEVANALAKELHSTLRIATRVRELRPGKAYRVYQMRREKARHLSDIRLAEFSLDDVVQRDGIRYVSLISLVALKVIALARRRQTPKGATDLADLRRLLLVHPELRGTIAVSEAIRRVGGDAEAQQAWCDLLAAPLQSDEDVDEGY